MVFCKDPFGLRHSARGLLEADGGAGEGWGKAFPGGLGGASAGEQAGRGPLGVARALARLAQAVGAGARNGGSARCASPWLGIAASDMEFLTCFPSMRPPFPPIEWNTALNSTFRQPERWTRQETGDAFHFRVALS